MKKCDYSKERGDRTSKLFFDLAYSGFLFTRKVLSLMVCIVLFTSLFAGEVFLNSQIVYADSNGTCGGSLTWYFTTATGNLTITGTGTMTDYGLGSAPWYPLRASITSLTLSSSITTIGKYAFGGCNKIT
ncbi:MAG: hypothetical protein LBL34_02370, partial [Clostridiales bacterium]|nr:hypothetical protein [Clostridiales bacterium]